MTPGTVLVLSGWSTYAFAAGSDDGPNHDRAVASSVSAGDDHRDRRAEAGDDRGARQARHHARHQARHHRHTPTTPGTGTSRPVTTTGAGTVARPSAVTTTGVTGRTTDP